MDEADEGAASQSIMMDQEVTLSQSDTLETQEVIVIVTDTESEDDQEEEDEEEEEQVREFLSSVFFF